MNDQAINAAVNGRVRLALVEFIGNLVLDRMAAEARAAVYGEGLQAAHQHLQELETDVANLKAKAEQAVDLNDADTDTLSPTTPVDDLVARMAV